ncbi:MAG: aspartyl/asparaginyl beta-hydroxylase domain-containing protein [Myxococcota bacterium]|nr:aspartyl/asparaginyl beta-hydroxylase domain-containing protein [Myxococcota bacterium]
MRLRERYAELGPKRFARWFLIKRMGKPIVTKLDQFMASQSLIGDRVVFPSELFSWSADFEANWKAVRDELDAVLARRDAVAPIQEIQPDQYKVSPDDKWRVYFFCGFGYWSQRHRAECPETTRLLDQVPGLTAAFFSVLSPGKHVPLHTGVTKGLVRCHLGLKVPRGGERCMMHIADQHFTWEEGKVVVFDDKWKHEVWNDTDEERVVLLFDFVRPMRWPGRAAWWVASNLLRVSPFVRDARRNQLAWEERTDAPTGPELEAMIR